MRYYPTEEDSKEVKNSKAEPWMLELLKLNGSYTSWGPHEDYMSKGGSEWDSRILKNSWSEFGPWSLDDLNECVNFYFEVERSGTGCDDCRGSGYNPATEKISFGFYNGPAWRTSITEDELAALVDARRIGWTFDPKTKTSVRSGPTPTVEVINEINSNNWGFRAKSILGEKCPIGVCDHDSINQHILVKARATRLGVYGLCPTCEGTGYVYVEPKAHVNLILWMLVPRKGCSRGVEVSNIQQEELPAIFAWLRKAADRNATRFKKIPKAKSASSKVKKTT